MEGTMLPRTIYLSRLIGLYCILIPPSLAIHKQATVDSVAALFHNPSTMLIMGIFTVIGGLAMILAHNLWSGGALPVVITLVGWLTLIKGLLFLLLPSGMDTEMMLSWLRDPVLFYVCLAPSFLIGIYLTYEGFRPRARS
jgi:vacuolar-type H+-ATPase subunit I/STV1